MSDCRRLVVTEDKRVMCACKLDPDRPERVCAYTLPADPACPRCDGTGWRTRRTTYDRVPERFAKILSEEWIPMSDTATAQPTQSTSYRAQLVVPKPGHMPREGEQRCYVTQRKGQWIVVLDREAPADS